MHVLRGLLPHPIRTAEVLWAEGGGQHPVLAAGEMGSYQDAIQRVLLAAAAGLGQRMDAAWLPRTVSGDRLPRWRRVVTATDFTVRKAKEGAGEANGNRQGELFLRNYGYQYRLLHEEVLPPCGFSGGRQGHSGVLQQTSP